MIISDFFFLPYLRILSPRNFFFHSMRHSSLKKKELKQHIGKFRKEKKYITSNKVSKYKYNHTENK